MLKKVSENEKKITVIVSKMRVLGQKKTTGEGANRPPPSLFRVNHNVPILTESHFKNIM